MYKTRIFKSLHWLKVPKRMHLSHNRLSYLQTSLQTLSLSPAIVRNSTARVYSHTVTRTSDKVSKVTPGTF